MAVAQRVFANIQRRFPHLLMLDKTAEDAKASDDLVSLSMTIPVQDGLRYKINLNLQNIDELHFLVANFWCEWFPCTDPARAREYEEAVCGFLSGECRIVEYYLLGKYARSELQKRDENGWIGIASHMNKRGLLLSLIPWGRNPQNVICNRDPD